MPVAFSLNVIVLTLMRSAIDDRDARQMALQRGLNVIGLLGVLGVAAQQNLVKFSVAIERLQQTTFRASPVLIESLLERFRARE